MILQIPLPMCLKDCEGEIQYNQLASRLSHLYNFIHGSILKFLGWSVPRHFPTAPHRLDWVWILQHSPPRWHRCHPQAAARHPSRCPRSSRSQRQTCPYLPENPRNLVILPKKLDDGWPESVEKHSEMCKYEDLIAWNRKYRHNYGMIKHKYRNIRWYLKMKKHGADIEERKKNWKRKKRKMKRRRHRKKTWEDTGRWNEEDTWRKIEKTHGSAEKLLHTETFTHRTLYTLNPLHTNIFTHKRLYTQTLLHTIFFTHKL